MVETPALCCGRCCFDSKVKKSSSSLKGVPVKVQNKSKQLDVADTQYLVCGTSLTLLDVNCNTLSVTS